MSINSIIKVLLNHNELNIVKQGEEFMIATDKVIKQNDDVFSVYIIKDIDDKCYMIDRAFISIYAYDNDKTSKQIKQCVQKNELIIDGNMIVCEVDNSNVDEILQRFISLANDLDIV